MNSKQLIGLVLLVLGVILVIFSVRGMKHSPFDKHATHTSVTRPLSKTTSMSKPRNSFFHKDSVEVHSHKHGKLMLVGGIVLVLLGGGGAYYYRKYR